MSTVGSIPVSGSQSRSPRHLLGWHDQDLAAHLFDQFAQIVEHVIDLRVAQISNFDQPRRAVESAGNLTVGLDQQRRDPSGGSRLNNLRQVVIAKPLGSGLFKLFVQLSQPRLILRLDDLPGAFPKFIDWQDVGINHEPLRDQKWVVADPAEKIMMLRQRRQDQRQARWSGMVLEHRAVDGTKKPFCIDVHLVLFPAVAVVHGRARMTDTTVGGDG